MRKTLLQTAAFVANMVLQTILLNKIFHYYLERNYGWHEWQQ